MPMPLKSEASWQRPSGFAPSDPLLEVLKRSVINPEQVQPSPLPSTPALPVAAMAPRQTGSPRAILSVAQPGLTAISYASLAAIGFPLAGIDPQLLHLTRAGTEIAMQWDGNGNSVFETGERLLFYADPRFSRWTNTDVYYLSVGDQPGLRMTSRPANPAPQLAGTAWLTQTYEINALYTPTCYCGRLPPGRDGDRWTWDDVRRPDRAHPSYDFGAFPALDATQPATLTLWLISYTDLPEYRARSPRGRCSQRVRLGPHRMGWSASHHGDLSCFARRAGRRQQRPQPESAWGGKHRRRDVARWVCAALRTGQCPRRIIRSLHGGWGASHVHPGPDLDRRPARLRCDEPGNPHQPPRDQPGSHHGDRSRQQRRPPLPAGLGRSDSTTRSACASPQNCNP